MTGFNISSLRTFDVSHDFMFMGGTPACYHCHHFNLFLDQTVSDALGFDRSWDVRVRAARDAFRPLLANAFSAAEIHSAVEQFSLAKEIFSAMGHGLLDISDDGKAAVAVGKYLHYGYCWREKYGRQVNCKRPMDAVAAGFAAAAVELARGVEEGRLFGEESDCMAMRHPVCNIEVAPATPSGQRAAIVRADVVRDDLEPMGGAFEGHIVTIAERLRDFTAGVFGNDEGLVPVFGVYVAMHLAGYYSAITYDTMQLLRRDIPAAAPVAEELFRESGHVCVFNTFGGVLLSPEWEGMVKRPENDVAEIVSGCVAIARGLGFGHWILHEIEPDRRFVLRATTTYESSFFLARYGVSEQSYEYFLQGAALAIVRLAHRVDWEGSPQLTQQFYNDLFRGDLSWRVEQTKSLHCGDAYSEVVVTRG